MTREDFDRAHNVRNDGQIHLCPINLDDMGTKDLELVPVHPALHPAVRAYASAELSARAHRLAGSIVEAKRMDRAKDLIYRQMPASVRW